MFFEFARNSAAQEGRLSLKSRCFVGWLLTTWNDIDLSIMGVQWYEREVMPHDEGGEGTIERSVISMTRGQILRGRISGSSARHICCDLLSKSQQQFAAGDTSLSWIPGSPCS